MGGASQKQRSDEAHLQEHRRRTLIPGRQWPRRMAKNLSSPPRYALRSAHLANGRLFMSVKISPVTSGMHTSSRDDRATDLDSETRALSVNLQ
jgi:hypothetical protein